MDNNKKKEYHKQYHLNNEDKILAKIKEYCKNNRD